MILTAKAEVLFWVHNLLTRLCDASVNKGLPSGNVSLTSDRWPRKGQAPSEGCKQPLSFVMPGPCGPSPRGLDCASDGVLADRPLLVQQLSVSREKTPQNILLSQLLVASETFLYLKEKQSLATYLSFSSTQISKCLHLSWTKSWWTFSIHNSWL